MDAFAQEVVVLSDGRNVTMQETNGMDLMIASALAKGDAVAMGAAATICSIVDVNGEKFQRPTSIAQVQAFMRKLKAKDFARLTAAYGRLNGDEDEGEAAAAG